MDAPKFPVPGLRELIDGVEEAHRSDVTDMEPYLDRHTGQVIYVLATERPDYIEATPELIEEMNRVEADQEDRYFRLRTIDLPHDGDIIDDFIDDQDEAVATRLARAFSGRGRFRRFKDAAHELGLIHAWHRFQRSVQAAYVRRGCKAHGIQFNDDEPATS
ncbi:MAG: UPF0158 family protein [Planctomycetota bacterium]